MCPKSDPGEHVVPDPERWWLVPLAFVALIATAMAWCLRLVRSDAILWSIMSTQRLTFFYWEQTRLLNLVPAIAAPIQDIRWNFYVQSAIMSGSFFGLIILVVAIQAQGNGESFPSITKIVLVTTVTGLLSMVIWGRYTSCLLYTSDAADE